jgi:hypothetical protein
VSDFAACSGAEKAGCTPPASSGRVGHNPAVAAAPLPAGICRAPDTTLQVSEIVPLTPLISLIVSLYVMKIWSDFAFCLSPINSDRVISTLTFIIATYVTLG